MKIWPLGVGGWMPAFGRQTSATLIEYKDRLILVDAGTGLSNLFEYQRVLDKYGHVDLILTHYHSDHVMGLFFLLKFLKGKTLTIWGPGKPHYKEGCASIIEKSQAQPFGTTGYETLADQVECRDYDESGFRLGPVSVAVELQKHTLPSFGISFDDKLHIATDTDVNKAVFKKPVKLILHECWAQDQVSAKEHSSMEALLLAYIEAKNELKDKMSVEAVGLIHRNPSLSDTEYASWTRKPFFIVDENQRLEI